MMIKSKKYWDDLQDKFKDDNLEPIEIVPLTDQNIEAKSLENETKLLLWKQKYTEGK
jgi:hypothetical protein